MVFLLDLIHKLGMNTSWRRILFMSITIVGIVLIYMLYHHEVEKCNGPYKVAKSGKRKKSTFCKLFGYPDDLVDRKYRDPVLHDDLNHPRFPIPNIYTMGPPRQTYKDMYSSYPSSSSSILYPTEDIANPMLQRQWNMNNHQHNNMPLQNVQSQFYTQHASYPSLAPPNPMYYYPMNEQGNAFMNHVQQGNMHQVVPYLSRTDIQNSDGNNGPAPFFSEDIPII